MGAPHVSDFGSLHKLSDPKLARGVAAGTGDATAVTGATIDRLGYGSLTFVVMAKAVLTATKTLTIAAEYQESSDGSNWDTATALQTATVLLTGGDGGTTEQGSVQFDLDLAGKKRYIRLNYTPDATHSGTDTFETCGFAILGGADKLPAT